MILLIVIVFAAANGREENMAFSYQRYALAADCEARRDELEGRLSTGKWGPRPVRHYRVECIPAVPVK